MGISGRGLIALCLLAAPAAASAQSVRALGQSVADGRGGFTIASPDSGFETVFTGTRLTVTFEDTGKNWFNVVVDGKSRPLALKPGKNTYTVILAPADGHVVRFTRRANGLSGDTHVTAIKVDE